MTSPLWYLGTDLGERLGALRRSGTPRPTPSTSIDVELARKRHERWQKQFSLAEGKLWQRRLQAAGITEGELLVLLGEQPAALQARMEIPIWLGEIERAYRAPWAEPFPWPSPVPAGPMSDSSANPSAGPLASTVASTLDRSPFLALVEPLVHAAHARMLRAIRELIGRVPDAPFDATTAARALLGHLPPILTTLISRVLVVELHAARLEERLGGDTSEARFQEFVHSLRRREVALDILERYPVLAQQLVLRLEQWEATGLELLGHLAEDAPQLRRRFAKGPGQTFGSLVEAQGSVSDPHRGGRTVFLLRFDSGLRLVYKPKSLGVEAAFQRLLTWINERGFEPPLRTLSLFEAGDHGWVEFVDHAPCDSPEALRRFYLRQGAYVALLYVLDATDFHHENLIAHGEHPILVDLESLFHPLVTVPELRNLAEQPGAQLAESVLRSGLLPQRTFDSREHPGVDVSGLGARPGQLTPQAYLSSTERGTDRMRFERRPVETEAHKNRPLLQGPAELLDYTAELSEGFSRLYRLLLSHRAAFLAPTGPLAAFTEVEVRVFFRHTAHYGTLLHESYHPHLLGNALERQRFFDALWAGVEERSFLAALLPFELDDLGQGDIPSFTTRADSRHLWTSTGARLANFFEDSGLKRAQRRVARLGPEDHERQQWVLRRSLDVASLANGPREHPSYRFREASRPADPGKLLQAARDVGERLVELVFAGPVDAHWLTVGHTDAGGWRVAPAGPDLYQGLPGIALFLGQLGELTGQEVYTRTARLALAGLDHQLARVPSQVQGLGFLDGWGGIIYSLVHLGVLWIDDVLLDRAEGLVHGLLPLVKQDEHLDLGTGAAGCLLALVTLAAHRPSERLWQTARACGERLLARAERQEPGAGWALRLGGARPLCGMAHGAAGIALALLRLYAATGDERFRDMAREGIEYERGLYAPAVRNWPDLRSDAGPADRLHEPAARFMWAWCHGAPGIGLGRLACLPHLDDPYVREEIAVAIETTLASGFGKNHGLCHGDLGNLDFLLEASRALGDAALKSRVYRMAQGILESMTAHGHLHGMPGNLETPGLFVGLAGIGHGLLRLAAPERIPCLLAAAPPVVVEVGGEAGDAVVKLVPRRG